MGSSCRSNVVAAMLLVAAFVVSGRASAQTVVEVQGGGSSLVGGYGATANFWRNGVDGWIGLGYLDGLRAGAFLRTTMGKDTLRLGNDALVMRFPTDLFSSGYNLLVQGASLGGGSGRTSYLAFAGASSSSLAAPSFQATSIEKPLGALFLQRRLSPTVRLTGNVLVAQHQTVVPGIQWQPMPDLTAALVAGMGAGSPYAASSVTARRGRLGIQALYAWNPDRFRRADVPGPTQTESEKENVALTYDIGSAFQLGVARQHFLQDSADVATPIRASGNSAYASGRVQEVRITAGVYDSHSEGFSNLSSYLAVGREVTSWLDGEVFLLQSRPSGRAMSTTPIVNLRWRLSPRLRLMQQLSVHEHHPTILFGANLITALGEFGADYQIVHQPFQPFQPFRSALNLTARLQLGRYSTNLGTYVRPDGAVDYSASGSTFLYMGAFGGVQPQQLGGQSMGRYVVRGTVRDESGTPVEGAAVALDGEMAFTNSRGEFFVRARRPKRVEVSVSLDEFLLPGRWEVVTAPTESVTEPEDRAQGIEIILRRAEAAPTAPVPPPPAPDTVPAPTADTLYRIVPEVPPPPPDADADRVPDTRDVCPATPAGGTVDASGCAPLFTPAAPVLTLRDVQFQTGKAVMIASSMPVLDSIARQLVALPEEAIEVAGHTDSSGIYRSNVVLARARAETVRHYLHSQGVPLERMTARGFGPDRPVTSNRTPEGRALNRRVELRRRSAVVLRPAAARRVSASSPGRTRSRSGRSPAPHAGSPRPRHPVPSRPAPPAGCVSRRSSPPGSSRC
jgi:outer membrane protein OmpA-like peptidoglycan-associated protein